MTFTADTRGVAPVLGFLIIFVALILSFTTYQAFIVPDQNERIEVDHNQEIENEMLDVRTAVLDARIRGERTRSTVSLGTQLPSRLLALNPPDPGGTIRTTSPQNITVYEGVDGDEVEFTDEIQSTRSIVYSPQYSEFHEKGTIRYENTVLYHDYDNTNKLLTGQELLSGSRVSLVPVEAKFQESGSHRVSVEPIPGILVTESISNPVIEIPTELDEDDWWELLDDEIDTDNGEDLTVTEGMLRLELRGSYDIDYAPVGINAVPREGERAEATTDINPAGDGFVQLSFQQRDGDLAELVFTNRGRNATIEAARINFATTHDASEPNVAKMYGPGASEPSAELFVRDDFESLDPEIKLKGDDEEDPTTTILMEWDDLGQDAFYVITLQYDTGDTGTYFVGFDTTDPVVQVDIDEVQTDTTVLERETIDVVATIFNIGGEGDTTIELLADDTVVNSETLHMGAGTGDQIQLQYETDSDDVGDLELEVRSESDSDTVDVVVEELDAESFFSVDIQEIDPVLQDEELDVQVIVENIGEEEADTQDIEFYILDGDTVMSEDTETDLTLQPGEQQMLSFSWNTEDGDAGEYEVLVESEDTDDTEPVEVLSAAEAVSGIDTTIDYTAGGSRLEFDVENTAGSDVDIESLSVTTNIDTDYAGNQESWPETIDGGSTETITIGDFTPDFDSVESSFVDPEDADVIVSLEFADGTELDLGISGTLDD